MSESPDIAAAFDIFNEIRLKSPLLEKVWHDGFGDKYATESRPDAFYSQAVLDQIIESATSSASDKSMLDIGCGHGLPGIFLARRLGMKLSGLDISPASIDLARKNAETAETSSPGLKPGWSYLTGNGASTGLDASSFALIVCLDVMLYFPDKPAAIKEAARLLTPDGIYAFTVWEQKGYNPRLGAQQVQDFRPLLLEAGLEIVSYEEIPGWSEEQGRVLQGIIDNEVELKKEAGEKPIAMLAGMARSALQESSGRRYVMAIARRKA